MEVMEPRMEALKKKRNRGPNFSSDEKVLLLSLVDKYKNILESKKTDGATWRDKESAWERVLREFNASNPSSTKRTLDNLKICYENIKRSTRKKASNSKGEMIKTGGGSATCSTVDPVFDLTLSILNKKTVFGMTNKFDGDGQQNCITENLTEDFNTRELQQIIQDVENTEDIPFVLTNAEGQSTSNRNELEESDESEEHLDWGNFKPEFLQAPLNKKLQNVRKASPENIAASSSTSGNKIPTRKWTRRRRPVINSSTNVARQYEDVAAIKLEVFRQQLSLMKKEEYKLKQWQHEELMRATETKRTEEKWELEKKTFLLDVRIKEAQLLQLDKLNRM